MSISRLTRLIAFVIALGASFFTLWKSFQFTHLVDYTYQVEIAYRLFRGELPYRDFMLVLTPGTYALMALVMHITGGYVHMGQVVHTMVWSFIGIILVYQIGQRLTKNQWITVMLLAPLIFSGFGLYPYPIYDIFATIAVLGSVYGVILYREHRQILFHLGTGMLIFVPFLFKQSIGGGYAALILLGIALEDFFFARQTHTKRFFGVLMGFSVALALFIGWLQAHGIMAEFYYQTFVFPQVHRDPSTAGYATAYRELLFFLSLFPPSKIALLVCMGTVIISISKLMPRIHSYGLRMALSAIRVGLLAIPPATVLIYVFARMRLGDPPGPLLCTWGAFVVSGVLLAAVGTVRRIFWNHPIHVSIPMGLFGAVVGALASHGFMGSNYGVWPLIIVYLYWVYGYIATPATTLYLRFVYVTLSVFFSVLLFWYSTSNTLFWFAPNVGTMTSSSYPSLRYLTTRGSWIGDMDTLLRYIDEKIPPSDLIALFPNEDPLYAAMARKNVLFCPQFFGLTCSVSLDGMKKEVQQKRIGWIIIKTNIQAPYGSYTLEELTQMMSELSFEKIQTLSSYDIYRSVK